LHETHWLRVALQHLDAAAVQTGGGVLKTYEYRSDESSRWLKIRGLLDLRDYCLMDSGRLSRRAGITVGTFDDPNWIKPATHLWTRSAVHWMAFPADVAVFDTEPQIDVTGFVAENFPPHEHGENCPACVLADLSRLARCCEQRDLHVLASFSDRALFVQCPNPTCNSPALVPKRS
jgi:hypothetical protein